jgi:Ca2+/H+ antiporter, TMEM165/GDT1 family
MQRRKKWHNFKFGLWLQAFTMTFIAEWGDRTKVSTIALAPSNNPVTVCHHWSHIRYGICTIIAVFSGRLIAGRISERMFTEIRGLLFLIFSVTTYIQIV